MAPRLKVFSWSDGFHVFTIATSSRAKALKAWGSSQDLFATGLATEVFEGADHSAALAAPGEVMQRGLLVDTGAIKVRPAQATQGKQSTKAQQQKVEVLVQALEALDQAHYLAETQFDAQAAEIEARRARSSEAYKRSRRKIEVDLKTARNGFQRP